VRTRFGKFLCAIGIHRFSHKSEVRARGAGPNFVFVGIFNCHCDRCGAVVRKSDESRVAKKLPQMYFAN